MNYNPYKWPYKWVTKVITLLLGVTTPFIAGFWAHLTTPSQVQHEVTASAHDRKWVVLRFFPVRVFPEMGC